MLSSAAWNQSSAKMEDVPAGWKGKGVLMVSGRRSSDPSSLQPVPKKVGFTDTTDTLSKKCGVFFVSLAKVNRKERLEGEGGMLVDKKRRGLHIAVCRMGTTKSFHTIIPNQPVNRMVLRSPAG